MITAQQLATIAIRRVIFHDIPQRVRAAEVQPILSEVETEIDIPRTARLKKKLVGVLGSKSAYPICFDPNSASPVPPEARAFTKDRPGAEQFVAMSRKLAKYLFEQQHGAMSPGLLCVLDATAGGLPGLIVMKLEREEGARVELTEQGGKKTFAMSVLDNLVLTDGTRLFKSAIFLRTGAGDEDFDATACDSQLNVASSEDLAKFWLRFLGCIFLIDPRVATERFYESGVRFINEAVSDPIDKNDLYEHLQSQLKAEKKRFCPRHFIEEYVPSQYQRAFREHLQSEGVALAAFTKDLSDIKSKLRRCAYHTTHDAVISVPVESAQLVHVQAEKIIVNDTLLTVDHK